MSVSVTAADVRSFYRASQSKFDALSPEAQRTVAAGARGRLHPEAVKGFNKGRKSHRRYVLGASKAAVAAKAQARADLAAKGVVVGKRGPLSREALAALKG